MWLMHSSSYPVVQRLLIQCKIENVFEVGRIAKVSLWFDINGEFDLQKRFSGFCCCILTVLSAKLVLRPRSKIN